ncbi:uncharacterized protein DS421_14g461570 [Arachis hypogaea]|nr:uncharacterized protein DS421_14g461570 [Arachis hypogaea]
MASPFKTKNLDEPIGPKDIKNIMEQTNYTNKYLQTLGQKLSSSSNSTHDSPKALEKPLFKPFKINPKIRQNLKSSIFKQDSESQDSDNGSDSPRINPIMTTSITKWKGLTKPHQHYHLQNTAPDLALEDRELGFNRFLGQLKGWWDNYLTNDEKDAILSAVKTNDNGEPILNENGKTIPDAVSILIFTIANHFIGNPSL